MARPLRIQEPGLWHHVLNRGGGSRTVFVDDDDRETFLSLLAECAPRFGVWCATACLMDNHYHLLVLDEHGRLSRAMRHLNGVYTQGFNWRHGRDGALFRGRFRSRVVDREGYLLELVRYVHANPVDAGLVSRAGDYPWSSHRHYLEGTDAPWLRKDLLGEWLGEGSDRAAWLDEFVHERVDDELRARLEPQRWSPVLGSADFERSMRARVTAAGTLGEREIPDARRLAGLTTDTVLRTALHTFELTPEELLLGRRGERNLPRLMTLLECRDGTAATAEQIAELFHVRRSTVPVLARTARELRAEDEEAGAVWERLMRALAED